MKTIQELGEKKVIEIILKCLEHMPNMPIPFGDDASAVEVGDGKLAVIKTDMLVGETDVPSGMSLRQASRKAVVMNISDLAAKGVRPIAALSSIGLPRSFTDEDIKQIGLGLNEGAREYDTYIIGGDTNEASDLIISCSLLGLCEKYTFMRRSGAKPGDIVAVTGYFGKTASGLKILLEGLSIPEKVRRPLIEAVLMPKARLKEGLALAKTGAITASIDSSDGLAWSLHELKEASGVGFSIRDVPVAPEVVEFAEENDLDPLELSLYGGEEYELILTVKPKLWETAKKAVGDLGTSLTRIGVVTSEKSIYLRIDEKTKPIERRGWEHFKMRTR